MSVLTEEDLDAIVLRMDAKQAPERAKTARRIAGLSGSKYDWIGWIKSTIVIGAALGGLAFWLFVSRADYDTHVVKQDLEAAQSLKVQTKLVESVEEMKDGINSIKTDIAVIVNAKPGRRRR